MAKREIQDESLVARYQSITGVREVTIVPVKQMGRIRFQVLANDVRLAFAGSFFDTPGKAVQQVESTLRREYPTGLTLSWEHCPARGEPRVLAADGIGDTWPAG